MPWGELLWHGPWCQHTSKVPPIIAQYLDWSEPMRVEHPGPSVRLMPWLSISSQWLLVRSFGPAVKLQPAGNSSGAAHSSHSSSSVRWNSSDLPPGRGPYWYFSVSNLQSAGPPCSQPGYQSVVISGKDEVFKLYNSSKVVRHRLLAGFQKCYIVD